MHSPMRPCCWRDDTGHRCDQGRGYAGGGHLGSWSHLRCWGGGCWLGRRSNHCVGGIGCRGCVGVGRPVWTSHDVGASRNAAGLQGGSCSERDLVNRALVVLLEHDQGGQGADDGYGNREDNQEANSQAFREEWSSEPDSSPAER